MSKPAEAWTGPSNPLNTAKPTVGQLWHDGSTLKVWNGVGWTAWTGPSLSPSNVQVPGSWTGPSGMASPTMSSAGVIRLTLKELLMELTRFAPGPFQRVLSSGAYFSTDHGKEFLDVRPPGVGEDVDAVEVTGSLNVMRAVDDWAAEANISVNVKEFPKLTFFIATKTTRG